MHGFLQRDVNAFKRYMRSLKVEDGFQCTHFRPKFYIIKEGKSVKWKDAYYSYKTMWQQTHQSVG